MRRLPARDLLEYLRGSLGRVRPCELAKLLGHARQRAGIGREVPDLVEQPGSVQVAVEDQPRGAGSLERFRILLLMVVGRERERYQERWLAGRREFGHGARAGAADDQVGL